MEHQAFLSRRNTPDPNDARPDCPGTLRYLGRADIGDADWDCYRCDTCRQYMWTAGTPGDTWTRIIPFTTVVRLRATNNLWMPKGQ